MEERGCFDPPDSPLPCSLGEFCPYLLNLKLF